MHRLAFLLLAIQSSVIFAMDPVTPPDSPIVVYQSDGDYDDIKANLEMAITDRGMLITNTLHISDMLERTASDTGLDKKLYQQAESLEFCSILMSYKMSLAHPANLAICPLTIGIYKGIDETDRIHVVFRRPQLLGDAEQVTQAVTGLLVGIVQEALE